MFSPCSLPASFTRISLFSILPTLPSLADSTDYVPSAGHVQSGPFSLCFGFFQVPLALHSSLSFSPTMQTIPRSNHAVSLYSYKPQYRCWELNLGYPQEQQMLLSIETSLQPPLLLCNALNSVRVAFILMGVQLFIGKSQNYWATP